MYAYYHSADLPWTISEEEQERFRRLLKRIFIFFLLFGMVMPFLPVPKMEREVMEEVPPRLAKLILERQEAVPPAPPPVKAQEPEAVQAKPAPRKPEPKPVTKTAESARKKAERSGLLAFKDDLADLRDDSMTAGLQKPSKLTAGATSSVKVSQRSLVTSNLAGGSGGINTARLSRDTGGGGLAGRATTQVSSPVGGGDGGGSVRRGGGGQAARSIEEIKLIFDKNKAAIYALYNRALREDPTLQGKVILKLTIAPSGRVTACEVVSSELRVPDLERKLVARVRLFDFGEKNVGVMVVTYPIDFLPS